MEPASPVQPMSPRIGRRGRRLGSVTALSPMALFHRQNSVSPPRLGTAPTVHFVGLDSFKSGRAKPTSRYTHGKVVKLTKEEQRLIFDRPAKATSCPVITNICLKAFRSQFFQSDEIDGLDGRTDSDELYRVYAGLCSKHDLQSYDKLTIEDLIDYFSFLGFKPLHDSVMGMLLQRSRKLSHSTSLDISFEGFAYSILMISILTLPDTEGLTEYNIYQPFCTLLRGILLPSALKKKDGRLAADIRWNSEIDDLLYVYWNPLERFYKQYSSKKVHGIEYSARLSKILNSLIELDEWIMFAQSTGISNSLSRHEMVKILKVSQTCDKEYIIDYAVPADRGFLENICLDFPEFLNAIVRCAFKIYETSDQIKYPSYVFKVNSLLHAICKSTSPSDLNFNIPSTPLIGNVEPNVVDVEGHVSVMIAAIPLCRKRGVYVRFGPSDAIMCDLDEGEVSVTAKIPPFALELRHKTVQLDKIADMETWVLSLLSRREQEEIWKSDVSQNMISMEVEPPLGSPRDYRTLLAIDCHVVDGVATLTPIFKYVIEVSLSNDGRRYSTADGLSSELVYSERLPSYELSSSLFNYLSEVFKRYCQSDDVYNETFLTLTKWNLFKNHYHIVEISNPVYAHERSPSEKIKRKKLILKRSELILRSDVLRCSIRRTCSNRWCGLLPTYDSRLNRGGHVSPMTTPRRSPRFSYKENVNELMLQNVCEIMPGTDIKTLPISEDGVEMVQVESCSVFKQRDVINTSQTPIFNEMSQITTIQGVHSTGITFPQFISTLARVCSDQSCELNCNDFLFRKMKEGSCRLPRIKKKLGVQAALTIGMPKIVALLCQRPVRIFDVFEGPRIIGRLSEGSGWITTNSNKTYSPLVGWHPYDTSIRLPKLLQLLMSPEADLFEQLLFRILGIGFLLAPYASSPSNCKPIGRCYVVEVPRKKSGTTKMTSVMAKLRKRNTNTSDPKEFIETFDACKASQIAAHLWEYDGSLASLWWQPAEGEVHHPAATMMVYGRDPNIHFYNIFSAFTSTNTLDGLRLALIRFGYVLSLAQCR